MNDLVSPLAAERAQGFISDPHYLARIDWLSEVRSKAVDGAWKVAASNLASGLDDSRKFGSEEEGLRYVREWWRRLLEEDRYLEAGALAWDLQQFDPRPFHIQRVMRAYAKYDLLIYIGAAGCGKSLAGISANFALDFLRDPGGSTIKIASVSDTNLKGNVWAKLNSYVQSSLFPLEHEVESKRMRISISDGGPDTGIEAILLGRGQEAIGKMKGYHPSPTRRTVHPVYGRLTRIRIGIDEAPHVPSGVLDDLGSPRSSVDPLTHAVKIVLTCNAVSENNWALKEAEPPGGYSEDAAEYLYDWDSQRGWHVCRLDARVTENVRQRRKVFPGFPTTENEKQYLNGTIITGRWWTFWAGWPPPGKANDVVIPTSWFDQAVGEPIFVGPVTNLAGVDPAYLSDSAVLAVGRYGQARGWLTKTGDEHVFANRLIENSTELRHCLVIDQLIYLEAKDGASQAAEVQRWCTRLQIEPNMTVVDATGSGSATTSQLQRFWGPVMGVNWKHAATPFRILAEDKEDARYQSTNIISEMYCTLRRWMEPRVRGLFINPMCHHQDKLKHQLTTRQFAYRKANWGFDVEDKHKYKSRGNESPGESDATVQIPFLIRHRGFPLPALTDETVTEKTKGGPMAPEQPTNGVADIQTSLAPAWVPPIDTAPVIIPQSLRG